jgi:PAS domain S-box-containing protein
MRQIDPVARTAGATRAAPESLRATLDAALEDALALTGSSLGYLYFYDEDTRQFTLHAWSREAMEECKIADPARVYDLDRTGLWGDVVRRRAPVLVNDFDAPNPGSRGYPEGHARLHRFLSIPVWDEERIVAVVGVANKPAPYDDADVRRLDVFMRGVWPGAQRLAVEERQRKLSAIVEQSPAAIATCDLSGRIDYVNARFVEWLGVGRERLLGRHIQDLNPAQAEDPVAFWAWLRAGGTWEREVRLGVGRARYARVAVSPLRSADGAVTHFVVVAEDVTERRDLEVQLQHAQRLEEIGTLAGGIAHDFNNVLAAAIGLASAARAELPGDADARADLDELLGVLGRATGLTRTLLTFGRRGSATLRPERLAEVLTAVGRLVRPGLRADVVLEVRAPDDGLVAELDRGQLEQVLVNLVNNARDALPEGGRIVVSAVAVEVDATQAARHLAAPGAYAVLGVEDTGVGMDDATLARIFDPFFTTKEPGRGTGLGLSMVHGIVRAHRGFIEVRSAPGRGARFDVYLPRRTAAAARAGDGAAALRSPAPHELLPALRGELDASRGAGG